MLYKLKFYIQLLIFIDSNIIINNTINLNFLRVKFLNLKIHKNVSGKVIKYPQVK